MSPDPPRLSERAFTLPAFGPLHADTEGNLWVGPYPVPGRDPGPWIVFDTTGRWLGEIPLPPIDPSDLEIGPDYILTVVTDDLGVERVALYDLVKPGRTP